MREKLGAIATKLRSYKVIFRDEDFERFLWKYAREVMIFEGIPLTGKKRGCLEYLMNQKAEEMLKKAEGFYLLFDRPVPMGNFNTDIEIREMVQREHMYGITEPACHPLYKSLKTPSS